MAFKIDGEKQTSVNFQLVRQGRLRLTLGEKNKLKNAQIINFLAVVQYCLSHFIKGKATEKLHKISFI